MAELIQNFVSGLDVKHEFVKRLHARYRREGIEMPYPTRTLDFVPATLARMSEMFLNSSGAGMPANPASQH